jgi:hypothetical protein
MTTPQPRPGRPAQTTPVTARPVAMQPRQATINDLAYELREIRLFMQKQAKARRRGGLLLIIAGAITLCGSLLGAMAMEQRQLQQKALQAMGGYVQPDGVQIVSPGLVALIGSTLMAVGASMQFDPKHE